MRALPALMGIAVLALPAFADDGVLGVTLTPRTTSFETGSSYLVRFDLTYACGPTRRIALEASGPEWTQVAVQDLDVREGRCATHTDYVAVAVDRAAPEDAAGELRVVARDGESSAEATVPVHVRRTTPAVTVTLVTLPPADLTPGATAYFEASATYTLPEAGSLRWTADVPDGWSVGVPPAAGVPAAEDGIVAGTFAVASGRDQTEGGEVLLRALLAAPDGVRVESPPVAVAVSVAVPPGVETDDTLGLAGAEASTALPRAAPRAPLWLVGAVFAAMVAGVYALESGEGRRKGRRR